MNHLKVIDWKRVDRLHESEGGDLELNSCDRTGYTVQRAHSHFNGSLEDIITCRYFSFAVDLHASHTALTNDGIEWNRIE